MMTATLILTSLTYWSYENSLRSYGINAHLNALRTAILGAAALAFFIALVFSHAVS